MKEIAVGNNKLNVKNSCIVNVWIGLLATD